MGDREEILLTWLRTFPEISAESALDLATGEVLAAALKDMDPGGWLWLAVAGWQ
jgi:hypothetical protein